MIFIAKKRLSGFTLIELVVVMAVIGIIATGITSIDFNRVSDQQRLDIFANEIASKLEIVRNNALIGKGIGINIETPEAWRVEIGNTSNGSMQSSYLIGGNWLLSTEHSANTIIAPYQINNINCITLDGTSNDITGTGTIMIDGNELSLSGCPNDNHKILEVTTSYKNLNKTVTVNTLNGLIQTN